MEQRAADELILSVAAGDMRALEALYSGMYREIYGYLLSMVGDPHAAEDLAQDTFLRVYKYAPKFVPSGYGKSWVYKIAGRLALTYRARNSVPTEELPETLADSHSAEDRVLDAQLVTQAMARLSEDERQVVSLHAVSGMPLREIAQLLRIPLGTVKWRHAQAIKKLKVMLGGNF